MAKKNKDSVVTEEVIKQTIEEHKEVLEKLEDEEFISDGKAYLPVWNETFKRYDMLIIHVNKDTEQTYIEREATRYDSEHRALQDIIKRVSEDFMKRK